MSARNELRYLVKFPFTAAFFMFVGTIHGVLQVLPPIRHWLDSIGSPYGGPGHMIDPLAHAHINIVGGVVMMTMAAGYYLIHVISGKPVSLRLANHSYWWLTLGVTSFYSTLLVFGSWEGYHLLHNDPQAMAEVHHYYGICISIASTVMGMGFWTFFANLFITGRRMWRERHAA
ncbi:MAG: cytochrome oxidase [Gammaproteobacteria bacterium]|nr:cytochrome oxidase [Gammaproteobacteria bacterium]